jgi:hypothetical protein
MQGAGDSGLQAIASLGILSGALVAAGTGQSDATLVPSDFSIFTSTTGSNFGARLPASSGNVAQSTDIYVLVNHCGQNMKVYPPTGGTIANGSANAAFTVTNSKTATFYCLGAGNWAASVSA